MDFRKLILAELAHQGHTRYWLGKRLQDDGVCDLETIMRYTRGERDTSGTVLGAALEVLGLKVVRADGSAPQVGHRKKPATA